MKTPLVVFDQVQKKFGTFVAVKELDFDIREGEFLAIMGPSGCGKTTTLRMLAGLEAPTTGEIRLNGRVMNDVRPHDRDTPLVWQSLALFPFLSARENVEFGLNAVMFSSSNHTCLVFAAPCCDVASLGWEKRSRSSRCTLRFGSLEVEISSRFTRRAFKVRSASRSAQGVGRANRQLDYRLAAESDWRRSRSPRFGFSSARREPLVSA